MRYCTRPRISGLSERVKMADKIKVTLLKSGIGHNKKIKETLKGLGLTKLHKTVELNNTPAIRGMIEKISFMVRIEI
jgi:large subunit ribosomal protein L30